MRSVTPLCGAAVPTTVKPGQAGRPHHNPALVGCDKIDTTVEAPGNL